MTAFPKAYGDTEGPLGFPMKDADARALDALLKANPGAEHVRAVVEKATTELSDGERADVAWIQTEAIDLQHEIVLASGFRDDIFAANPIVTVNHCYHRPPVGRSLWRKRVKDGDRRGVKAKTVYPARPKEWPSGEEWPSDSAWALVQSGLMSGKSIGFLALKAHAPTPEEIHKRPELVGVGRIIEEWVLLEYACCWQPVNPQAVNEAVSKSLTSLGLQLPPARPRIVAFTPLEEYERALRRALSGLDPAGLARKLVTDVVDRRRGRI